MAKERDLKRRIRSVENTRQITHTMEMVAASKLRRATDRVYAARPYSERLTDVIRRLVDPELRERYPLLRQPDRKRRTALILLTSNRGLAGAFNVNLIREARGRIDRLRADGIDVELHVVGKKGINFFKFRDEAMATTRTDIDDRPTADDAASLVDSLVDRFARRELDAVDVVYAQFRSPMSTPPAIMRVLPVEVPKPDPNAGGEDAGAQGWQANYLLSPSGDEILDRMLPLYVRNRIYRALVETAAAEQGARRTAMKSATDNAGEMLEDLQRTYNRVRQAQITQEIAEIVGGAAALE